MVLFETDDIRVRYVENEGFVFLHLDVLNWNMSAYRDMKKSVADAKAKFRSEGHDLIFATTDDKKITKFWSRIHPLEELTTFGPHQEYWIGAWSTEESVDGS